MSSEAREPHSVFFGLRWYLYLCKICGKRFLLGGSTEIVRPRACSYCGVSYTQFKTSQHGFDCAGQLQDELL